MDFFVLLDEYFDCISLPLNPKQKELFFRFYQLLKQKNPELNLTRIHSLEEIIRKHFVDSCMILPILDKYRLVLKTPIMDLGTGAGFPSIPLAILLENQNFLLVESRKNRVEFLLEVKKELGLNHIEIIHKTLTYKDQVPCGSVITRALESMKETAIRTANSLPKEGLLVFLKGPNVQEELNEMNEKYFELILKHDYVLPSRGEQRDERTLIVFRKKVSKEYLLSPVVRHYFQLEKYLRFRKIESKQNEFFKFLKKLENSKEIKKEKRTLIAGEKIVNEFIEKFPEKIQDFLFTKELSEEKVLKYFKLIKNSNVEYVYLEKELVRELEISEYSPPYLLVETKEIQEIKAFDYSSSFLILPLQNPLNLGACVRTAIGFGISNIVLTKESANPFLLKSIRSSSGAVFLANFFSLKDDKDKFINSYRNKIFLLDIEGEDIRQLKVIPKNFGLIIGEEGQGIPKEFYQYSLPKITIPISKEIDSLNAAVSCGIALFYLENRK
ncbi:MAG: 16S rRNA (guanine(527)-N(7))-methyltransferase RsmG [Leptospiraceae bacterium]|nr:16S rRNA (guanine(527)-N(7))-methyltransferase RsmG [Leptospiraceae bacterium]MDW7976896.1 16S rRNA (guanine(527)-N(7))-methyltransferase RsmG [Leptospiraceae bacterium]